MPTVQIEFRKEKASIKGGSIWVNGSIRWCSPEAKARRVPSVTMTALCRTAGWPNCCAGMEWNVHSIWTLRCWDSTQKALHPVSGRWISPRWARRSWRRSTPGMRSPGMACFILRWTASVRRWLPMKLQRISAGLKRSRENLCGCLRIRLVCMTMMWLRY